MSLCAASLRQVPAMSILKCAYLCHNHRDTHVRHWVIQKASTHLHLYLVVMGIISGSSRLLQNVRKRVSIFREIRDEDQSRGDV